MSLVTTAIRNGVLILTLNDAPRRNVLSSGLCTALSEAVTAAADNPEAHAIVITGTAPAFCAGADLNDLRAAAAGKMAAIESVYKSFMAVAMSPLPTLAAV